MKFNLRLRKEVGHAGLIPRGWQMAWYEPRRLGVYYPAPLHWIARAVRNVIIACGSRWKRREWKARNFSRCSAQMASARGWPMNTRADTCAGGANVFKRASTRLKTKCLAATRCGISARCSPTRIAAQKTEKQEVSESHNGRAAHATVARRCACYSPDAGHVEQAGQRNAAK